MSRKCARKGKWVFVGGLEVEGSGWPPFAVAESGDNEGKERPSHVLGPNLQAVTVTQKKN
jgi:hypothetical protein